ncbi:hypothetical protein EDC17_10101 [Sphingobacterium alimentarium]|uniref:Uncharacterized protein n=1 Tax=Sphingobacterium alimentarium TaxID=797292 RepID=A0A4R3VZ20_9SPHI|nr:hypothetical protein EDC17_10101 [Sphingobacterium alimentarium]
MIQPKSFILFLLSILFISISFAQKPNKKNSSVSRAETKLIYDNTSVPLKSGRFKN